MKHIRKFLQALIWAMVVFAVIACVVKAMVMLDNWIMTLIPWADKFAIAIAVWAFIELVVVAFTDLEDID